MPLIFGHGMDQAPQFANQPLAEPDAVRREAAGQSETLTDQVSLMPTSA